MHKARLEIFFEQEVLAQVYTINAQLTKEQFIEIPSLLTNQKSIWRLFLKDEKQITLISNSQSRVTDHWWHKDSKIALKENDTVSEVSYHFGITDNLANTLQKIIEQRFNYTFQQQESVYSSQLFLGKTNEYNTVIQKCDVHKAEEKPIILQERTLTKAPVVTNTIDLEKEDLIALSKKMVLGLSEKAMIAIRNHFRILKRNPTDIELETFAQTWSEHCKHTIFSSPIDDIKNGLYKTYIKGATYKIMANKHNFCISVFSDNAGAIRFTDDWLVAAKVETHNSPSALEPFGGSITGILGVNRDVIGFGLGSKPIANTYGFCFADPNKKYTLFSTNKPILSPRKIIDGVIKGVNVGGNCSGIPTVLGFAHYHERFIAKPLVYVGTIGLIPRKIGSEEKLSHIKEPQPGDYIVIIGGHTGKDGIHGATFSSEALNDSSPVSAVQIGDPITQKKLSDALIKEARDLLLYNAITDNGAGGLSSSVGEMGKNGFKVQLEKVPLKYPGMMPWEIWVSESQERMTLSVPPEKYPELEKIMKKHDVDIAVIGTFNNSGRAIVSHETETIMDLSTDFLHNGNPVEHLRTREITLPKQPIDYYTDEINLQNQEFISKQYDHEVQGGSLLKPLQGKGKVVADAAVVRPILELDKGVALSQGISILHSDDQDPYYMAANAIDTAIRNLIVVGSNPDKIALLDNFCWSNSTDPERLWQLKRTAEACYDYAVAFNTPFISGKDSMFNDFKGHDENGNPVHLTDPPTLLVSGIGIVDDTSKCISCDVKFSGDLLYLIGDNNQYRVNAERAFKLYKKVYQAINMELLASAISVNNGGLAHALHRKSVAGQLEISINNFYTKERKEYPSRIVVSINPNNKRKFEELFSGEVILIGKVI